jgi:hypothetical protein
LGFNRNSGRKGEEGRVELCKEELVYVPSGLTREDEYAEQMAREATSTSRAKGTRASSKPRD